MDTVDSVSFSSVVAGMLLFHKSVSSSDVVNVMSRLSNYGVFVNDEDDNMECLMCCVDFHNYDSFYLRNGYNYDTDLGGISVFQYLKEIATDRVISLLQDGNDRSLCLNFYDNVQECHFRKRIKKKKYIKFFIPFIGDFIWYLDDSKYHFFFFDFIFNKKFDTMYFVGNKGEYQWGK